MRRLGKVRAMAAIGLAVGMMAVGAGQTQAQCANGSCGGHMAGDYVPGGSCAGCMDSFGSTLGRSTQPLFNNYFTQGNANSADAALYISPNGVPGWVGHTYNTYQPLNPHHYLYQHHDRYHSYYDGGKGLNRTHAKYYAPPVRTAGKWLYKAVEIPR